jgi:thioredoxin-dependent peroxiredoxin
MGLGMKRIATFALGLGLIAGSANAALKVGDKAPDFTVLASLGGKQFQFALADALKKGPVVLYFYPAAFTPGCTIEAHEFAEATDKFAAMGATVIGVSTDKIETLDKFSVTECRNKFAVAADPDMAVTKSYDAQMMGVLSYANRTSYVISPDNKIIFEYSAMDPTGHVDNTLAAVKKWAESKAAPAKP